MPGRAAVRRAHLGTKGRVVPGIPRGLGRVGKHGEPLSGGTPLALALWSRSNRHSRNLGKSDKSE